MKQPDKRVIGVGLIGYGFAGKTFHAPLISAVPQLELRAIASSNSAKVHSDWPAVAVDPSPQALIARDDIELVVVATPNDSHYPLAEAALHAGKHVVVDKPFTTTLAEAEALCELSMQHERVLTVFHNRRWDSDFLTVQTLIESGELGEVTYFESHFDRFRPQIRDRWREQPGPGSGIWFDLGPHLLDQALLLFGEPERIVADVAMQRAGAQTDDYFHVQLHYGARRVILHGSMLVAATGPRMILHGTRGSYVKYGLDPQEDALKAGHIPPAADWGVDPQDGTLTLVVDDTPTVRQVPTIPGNYPALYEAVYRAICGEGPNPVPPEEALRVMRLLERVRREM